MSSRTHSRNAFATALNGAITSGATTITVVSTTGLSHPIYLVIDLNDVGLREYIKVATISGTSLQGVTRGLAGSSAGAQAHADGATVHAVPVHQHLADIFTDIEALEAAGAAHYGGTDIADHPEATPSTRGFMSATDKTKLDGLSSSGSVTGGNAHDHAGGDGAQIAHSGLSGLTSGDPHTQYLLKAGSAADVPDHTHIGTSQAGTLTNYVQTADLPAPTGCVVTRSAALSIPNNAGTLMVYDTELADPENWFNGSDQFTVDEDGWYSVTAFVSFGSNATGRRAVTLLKNAVGVNSHFTTPAVAATWGVTCGFNDLLDDGDVITISVFQNTGAALNVTGRLSIVRYGIV